MGNKEMVGALYDDRIDVYLCYFGLCNQLMAFADGDDFVGGAVHQQKWALKLCDNLDGVAIPGN